MFRWLQYPLPSIEVLRVYNRDKDLTIVRSLGLEGYSRIIKEEGSRFTSLYLLNLEQRFPSLL